MKPIVSDELLRDAVARELEKDPEVSARHISVTAIDGAVTLGGHVGAIHEKHVAVRAAERVEGVRAVADDVEVRPTSLHERPDDEIAEEIAHLRGWRTQIPDSVAVRVSEGRVILHGQVESTSQREATASAVPTSARQPPKLRQTKPAGRRQRTGVSDRSLKKKLRKKAKKSKRLKIAKDLERDGHHGREKKR
jgi:osmotically-inducible protein OsmY